MPKANRYTRTWFELFLETRPYTQNETDFVIRHLPNPPYRGILDVCCGQGRHANQLAQHGYKIVGIDLDEQALAIAQQQGNQNVQYIRQDMRHLERLDKTFDAVICLWQSFGYFDKATNETVLSQMSRVLNPRGRLILDIYNLAFWEKNQGRRLLERKGIQIEATNTMRENRLTCQLVYGADKGSESFDWQLYSLPEITDLAARYGLKRLVACVEGNERRAPNEKNAQMQLVFERI